MYKILIQLVGEQSLPNIFPILSLHPNRVVNIFTMKTEKIHRKIANWCAEHGKVHGVSPKFVEHEPIGEDLSSVQSGIFRILRKEVERMQEKPGAMMILNMTGGTKAMAASAISLCQQISGMRVKEGHPPVPICYLNPNTGELEFVTCSERESVVVVRPARELRLTVAEIIESGGDTKVVSARRDWTQVYPAAIKLKSLADRRVLFTLEDARVENYAEKVKSPLSTMLEDKDPNRLKKLVVEMKKLAAWVEKNDSALKGVELCGFEVKNGDIYFSEVLQKEVDATKKEISSNCELSKADKKGIERKMCMKLNNCANFFVGGWWEVIVAHAYQKLNPESEVLWSVETAQKNNLEHVVETDIIATDGRSLCGISCKRGMHLNKVTQELEQHCTRTALLGGIIHKRIIAVYNSKLFSGLNALMSALRLTLWDSKKVEAIENNIAYRGAESLLGVAGSPQVKAPENSTLEQSEHDGDDESAVTRPSFIKRLTIAVRYLFGSGKHPQDS